MKRIIALSLASVALSGCASGKKDWIAPATVGAIVGVAIHEAVKPHQQPQAHPHPHYPHRPPHHHYPPPVVYAPPPVYQPPRVCHQIPIYNPYGHVIGFRTDCH